MKNYYAEELSYLRELGARFAEAHPGAAPLLGTRSTDPDVERILEGVAFLCGLIHERLDQNFPEVVYGLLELATPDVLKARPSQTIVALPYSLFTRSRFAAHAFTAAPQSSFGYSDTPNMS